MRRLRFSGLIVLAVSLAGLIVALGALQWRWVREASQAERQRLQSLLDARVRGFSQDVDREVSRAYGWFVEWPGRGDGPSSRTQAERAAQWFGDTTRPQLVREVLVVRGRPGMALRLSRFEIATGEFVPVEWPADLSAIHDRLEKGQPRPGEVPSVWRVGPRLEPSVPALVVAHPVLRLAWPRGEPIDPDADIVVTIARLDREYLAGVLLPELASRHFPDEPGFRFRVLVRADADNAVVFASPSGVAPETFASADATASLLRVRNDFLDRPQPDRPQPDRAQAERGTGDNALAGGRRGTTREPGDEVRDRRDGEGDRGRGGGRLPFMWARAMSDGEAVLVTSDTSPGGPRWTLSLVHVEGSIDRAIARSRRWNLGLSLGVLALLAASVGLALVASQRAQRLARERMEFVAGVSHELRTPLSVIRSAAENLADGVVDDRTQVRQYGVLIADEGRKLSDMVDQVLTFAGLESGQPLHLQPVPPQQVVEAAVHAVEGLVHEAGVAVDVAMDGSLPHVVADAGALARAIANLVVNAVKYGGSGGWVGVSATADPRGRVVRFSVEDRGPGIPVHDQQRVFEPFFRGADAVAAQIHGNGLGLSLVRRIAEQHGGHVSLVSQPGHGSTFTLAVPASTAGGAVREPGGGRLPSDLHGAADPSRSR